MKEDTIYRVLISYEMDVNTMADFIQAVKPFTMNIDINKLRKTWDVADITKITYKEKVTRINDMMIENQIKDILIKSHELSSREVYRKLQTRHNFNKTYKSAERYLMKMSLRGELKIRKSWEGCVKNFWSLA